MKTFHFIENKNIDYIHIEIQFQMNNNLKELVYIKLLNDILLRSTNKIKDRYELKKEMTRKLILNYNINTRSTGIYRLYNYTFSIPRDNLIKKFNLKESINLALDLLFDPNIEDNKFAENVFNEVKELNQNRLNEYFNNMGNANDNIIFSIYDNYGLTYDERQEILNNINPENLYEFYKNLIKNKMLIFVSGNFEEKTIRDIFNEYMSINEEVDYDLNYYGQKELEKKDDSSVSNGFNQTELNMFYQIKNINKEDYINTLILNMLLSGSEGILFDEIRNKRNLAYQINKSINLFTGWFNIFTYIKPSLIDNTKEVINNIINEILYNEEEINKRMPIIIRNYKNNVLRKHDDEDYFIDDYITNLLFYYSDEKIIEQLEQFNFDNWIKFLNKIEYRSTIVCRGDIND